ncbi:MAG: LuxR C-terminal-related transcriptional regulator [Saprospiraceae bacterium]
MKKIFVAKAERLLCDAISSCCESLGLYVIGTSTNGEETLEMVKLKKPDYLIVETQLPSLSGLKVIEALKESELRVNTVLYLKNHNPNALRQALSLNVDSLLFPEDGVNELAKCFGLQKDGQRVIRDTQEPMMSNFKMKAKQDILNALTPAQLRILSLIGTYKTMPQIAEKLRISPHTVNNHVANIRKKLDIRGRGVVLKYALAIKHRLLEVNGELMVSNHSTVY